MPQYKVIKQGFFDSKLYTPGGKRTIVTVDKAFKPCPNWLEPIQEESGAQRKKRESNSAKKLKAMEEKAAQDKRDIDAVMFTSAPSTAQVETL